MGTRFSRNRSELRNRRKWHWIWRWCNRSWEESQEISNLLAEIFVEEAATPTPASPRNIAKSTRRSRKKSKPATPTSQSGRQVAGLDSAHTELLFALSKQPVWQRQELATIATQLDLMLDGAIEVINEVAFDRCDEALMEGDDPIEVNSAVLQELLA
ncbi:hypothetical protein K9N68_03915 [Kovacikia minuta CCNUW1]|uniref:tellurite resistance TerB C-terminal domain-containing protein n=1 Tax=Kovacikia minuta TaxID=2931930 RepID=UPI001CC9781A|nr:tellurite resistance TerB C-terminal domain-containing protein [Kovacikia minuta]UBF27125.1 hypothetical protein K9N68_03915 [Kovacikia minuta CCNUW1]